MVLATTLIIIGLIFGGFILTNLFTWLISKSYYGEGFILGMHEKYCNPESVTYSAEACERITRVIIDKIASTSTTVLGSMKDFFTSWNFPKITIFIIIGLVLVSIYLLIFKRD